MKYVEGAKRVFMDTGTRFPREVIWSVAAIKQAAAKVNGSIGKLDKEMSGTIAKACGEVMGGKHDDLVVVDVFQTGSGTGINMNVNELVAERATELLGKPVHPNDHVNMGQSSNDVLPTAIRVAAVFAATDRLLPALDGMTKSLTKLSNRTSSVYKSGRTHLRDAMPVTLGQEFGAYADAMSHDKELLESALAYAKELPIGGTAVGTGINAPPRFGKLIVEELNAVTKLGFKEAKSRFRAMRLLTDLLAVSSVLKVMALDLHRLCQDLRLMFSGPLTGLGEIDLPTQQEVAGSSIMPGKTNPVTVESTLLVCAEVIGLDQANLMAGTLGEFELSMGVPLLGYNIVTQLHFISEALNKLSSLVIDHVVPDKARLRGYAETSPALITVASPVIGYDKASKIGKKLGAGYSIRAALKDLGYKDDEIDRILDLDKLVNPSAQKKG